MSPATRLNRDYSAPGLYFVTICANYKRCIFGRVSQTSVELSALGRIASECWTAIPFHFARVNVHGFMVMPNHMHGIIEIVTVRPAQQGSRKVREEGLAQHAVPLQETQTAPLRLQPGSLSVIVRSFKAEVTRRGRLELNWKGEVWQRNYFDRVIRDGQEYSDASHYIAENPLRWIAERERLERTDEERPAQHAVPLQRSDWSSH